MAKIELWREKKMENGTDVGDGVVLLIDVGADASYVTRWKRCQIQPCSASRIKLLFTTRDDGVSVTRTPRRGATKLGVMMFDSKGRLLWRVKHIVRPEYRMLNPPWSECVTVRSCVIMKMERSLLNLENRYGIDVEGVKEKGLEHIVEGGVIPNADMRQEEQTELT